MRWKAAAAVGLLLAFFIGTGAASTGQQYINSSEPAFLHDIGPQDERQDHPAVAGVVALGVGLVLYRGIRQYNKEQQG